MTVITSRSNNKVKLIRSLRHRKPRQENGLFVVEGIHHVGEAISAMRKGLKIDSIYYAPELLSSTYASDLITEQSDQGLPCYAVSREVFDSMASKENPQGILAVVEIPTIDLDELTPDHFPWIVALFAPQDPGNVGAILRTIDAVGASGLILLDHAVDPYHPSAVRASMGALFWYPVAFALFEGFIRWASQFGYNIYGTSANAQQDYRSIPVYKTPAILLMGSERAGLTPAQQAKCTHMVRVPMVGRVSSLNLAVATGVMLYAMGDRLSAQISSTS